MKKNYSQIGMTLLLLTALFICGYYLGRNKTQHEASDKISSPFQSPPAPPAEPGIGMRILRFHNIEEYIQDANLAERDIDEEETLLQLFEFRMNAECIFGGYLAQRDIDEGIIRLYFEEGLHNRLQKYFISIIKERYNIDSVVIDDTTVSDPIADFLLGYNTTVNVELKRIHEKDVLALAEKEAEEARKRDELSSSIR